MTQQTLVGTLETLAGAVLMALSTRDRERFGVKLKLWDATVSRFQSVETRDPASGVPMVEVDVLAAILWFVSEAAKKIEEAPFDVRVVPCPHCRAVSERKLEITEREVLHVCGRCGWHWATNRF